MTIEKRKSIYQTFCDQGKDNVVVQSALVAGINRSLGCKPGNAQ
jgi:hypothetical protein